MLGAKGQTQAFKSLIFASLMDFIEKELVAQ